jgi:hydroxymethylbilane synthase
LALRLATRGSTLARWQADEVARLLRIAHSELEVELIVVETTGDSRQDIPISDLGGQGMFVKEVQAAVLAGRADMAVHSAKDLPSATAPGLSLAAIPARADPRDALVGSTLAGLAPGALVATGSARRRAQLAWLRPDLTFAGLRGNMATRLNRVPSGGAIVVAVAALERLGWSTRADEVLDVSVMLPQVGQGAIGVECRDDDERARAVLAAIDDEEARLAVEAERAFLARLGGGCTLPVGAYAHLAQPAPLAEAGRSGGTSGDQGGSSLTIEGLLASPDGRIVLRSSRVAAWSVSAGRAAGAAIAEDLLSAGGAELMNPGEMPPAPAGVRPELRPGPPANR